jgi:hypothetical protein
MNSSGSSLSVPPSLASPSLFVTLLAWCMIGVSALACLVSMASLLMLLAKSHGTANASLVGGLMVIGLPPVTLVAGIGLLRRWPWAFGYMLVLLGFVAVWNVARMFRGPTPQHTYVSPTGVPTTVLASSVNYSVHVVLVAVSVGLIATLLTNRVRAEFRPTRSSMVRSTPKPNAVVEPLRDGLLHAVPGNGPNGRSRARLAGGSPGARRDVL